MFTHGANNTLAELDHEQGEQIGKDRRQHVAGDHAENVVPHGREIHAALGDDGVNGFSRIERAEKRELVGKQCEGDSKEEETPFL